MDILCFPVFFFGDHWKHHLPCSSKKTKKLCQNGFSNNVCNFATFSKLYPFKKKYHEKFDIDMTFLIYLKLR